MTIEKLNALALLVAAESEQTVHRKNAAELLGVNPDIGVGTLLPDPSRIPPRATDLLGWVDGIINERRIKWVITDWPFEHFWDNPHEPDHSQLLGHFLNPLESHGCGLFLLGKLFDTFSSLGCDLPDYGTSLRQCRVTTEKGRIDLLILCDTPEAKYAVIIENKVNAAVDQPRQLQTYVERVHAKGFAFSEIYVFYLPLNGDKHPKPSDLAAIKNYGIHYGHVTFETHILSWLDAVINETTDAEIPEGMHKGMRENLSHYRNLIRYRAKRQKEIEMKDAILKQIAAAEAKNALPTWSQVKDLRESATILQSCFESVLRGKLLLGIQVALKEKGVNAQLLPCDDSATPSLLPLSPYDERFDLEQHLALEVNHAIGVCIGAGPGSDAAHTAWIGYYKIGSVDEQAKYASVVVAEAQRRYGANMGGPDEFWYGWGWCSEFRYENCLEAAFIQGLASLVIEMRDTVGAIVTAHE